MRIITPCFKWLIQEHTYPCDSTKGSCNLKESSPVHCQPIIVNESPAVASLHITGIHLV
ncbi:hypothetical protein DPMN_057909 [Dreissena polymorpha]|uniref:Uncharacterized protein n=1 Tax=Dreissena polymorpha TaxID=45954 RepID=A0A9D4HEU7_DREPO|nr:hypothetical protein DPMN_057909 [Dreissena polymorpha]